MKYVFTVCPIKLSCGLVFMRSISLCILWFAGCQKICSNFESLLLPRHQKYAGK